MFKKWWNSFKANIIAPFIDDTVKLFKGANGTLFWKYSLINAIIIIGSAAGIYISILDYRLSEYIKS